MEFEGLIRVASLAGLAVLAVEQILKLKVVPVEFANKYPVLTNVLLSIAASLFAVYQDYVQPVVWQDWLLLVVMVVVVAAVVYNNTLRNSPELRKLEG